MSDKSPPLISIIIPVYNVEPYLRQCLDSVVNQTLREIEIICVNGCSTDGSLAILREYEAKDLRIIVKDQPMREGLSTARNVGMAAATGTYMLFIDSDDFVDTDLCRKSLECAKTSGADLVLYDYACFRTEHDLTKVKSKLSSLIGMDPSDKTGLLGLKAYAWTKLIRSDHARSLKLQFPDGLIYEDIPVHWRLVLQTKNIALLPERLCFYRQRSSSLAYPTDWKLTDIIYEFDSVKTFLLENNLYDTYRDIFLCQEINSMYVVYDNIDSAHKTGAMELLNERMNSEHWRYIESAKVFSSSVRDFFLALRGSTPAKFRRKIWLLARSCYRCFGR
jgi:glycosyltransferase involved in cell wall biosynthesis